VILVILSAMNVDLTNFRDSNGIWIHYRHHVLVYTTHVLIFEQEHTCL